MQVLGYSDRLSARGNETLKFMVSCRSPHYDAALVRLINGDLNPRGPGFKEEEVPSAINGRYPGREQHIHLGAYVEVPTAAALDCGGGVTLQAWVFPTSPGKCEQALLSRWAEGRGGYSLMLNAAGALELRVGDGQGKVVRLQSGQPLRKRTWYYVAATFDARSGRAGLRQEPVEEWPHDASRVRLDRNLETLAPGGQGAPLLMAASKARGRPNQEGAKCLFNGKIDRPRVFTRALDDGELASLRDASEVPPALMQSVAAAWDFSREVASARAYDLSANQLHGQVVNAPARAMTGFNWNGRESDFKRAPEQYGAIYFHDDDLDDAAWDVDFELTIPEELRSGVYAIRLRSGEHFDYVPFFVRPAKGKPTAKILYLAPTFSYMAYGNERLPARPGRVQKMLNMSLEDLLAMGTPYEAAAFRYMVDNNLTSLYDFHSDGSGVAYTTRLRPLLTMRPLYRKPITKFSATHQFNEDMYLVDWLEAMGHSFDVATDEDLHFEGKALLDQYRVVVTGSHPEYWSDQMFTALEDNLRDGGRVMYLGGNGFYWVTSLDPDRPHLVEMRRSESGVRTWQADPGEYYHSTTGELCGLWRYRAKTPQRILGVGMTATGGDPGRPYKRTEASHDPRVAFMFEGIEDEVLGDFGLHFGAAAGWELDRADPALGTPAHAIVVASSFGHSDVYQLALEELWKTDPNVGGTKCPDVRADIVLVEYPRGGAAFSVGSISYCGSLQHDNYRNNISRLTDNVLRAFAAERLPTQS